LPTPIPTGALTITLTEALADLTKAYIEGMGLRVTDLNLEVT
jgi:hypothetical protein